MPRPGDIIDERYQLTRLLGKRGSAEIWEAEHEVVGRRVNLKLLEGDVAHDSKLRERFIGEARAASVIAHPSAVEVYDVGVTSDGVAYLVTEPLGGELLHDVLLRQGTFPVEDACQVAIQVLEALEAAHGAGIVHGRLGPSSIVLRRGRSEQLVVKILDFGTELPAACEETAREPAEAGGDIRAMGALLYEMLTGRPAFPHALSLASNGPLPEKAESILDAAPAVPAELGAIVNEALADGPHERLASAKDMAKLLAPFASRRSPSLAPRESAMPFLSPEARRSRGMARLERAVLGKVDPSARQAATGGNVALIGWKGEAWAPAKEELQSTSLPVSSRRLKPEDLIEPRIPRPPRTPRHILGPHAQGEGSIAPARVRLPRRRSHAARDRAKIEKAMRQMRSEGWTWRAGLLAAAGLGVGLLLAHFFHF